MMLSAVKFKSYFHSHSSVLGFTVPGRNLAGCPSKDVLRWALKILPRSGAQPSALLAQRSDLVTPLLKDPYLEDRVT
jgi:hypothetical protein